MSVPGIGAKVADKILELREPKDDLELDDLNQVPYLRITQPLLDCLDFTSFENKEGRGSLYDRHRERVRSVDKLIGKWDGTGQGQVKERGRIWVHLIKSRQQGENHIIISRKGIGGNRPIYPRN